MSITRSMDDFDGDIIFECDGCGTEEETHTPNFTQALNHIKDLGWIVRNEMGEWHHYCCKECE